MKKTVFLSIVACSFLYSAEPMNKSLLKNRANYAEDNGGVYGNKMYIYKDAVETQREINEQIRSGSRNIEIASPTIDRNSKVRGVETLVEGGNLNIIGRNADVNIASPKIAPNSGVKEINTAVNLNNINLLANTNNTVNIAAPTVSGANPLTVINTNVNLGSLNTAANQNMTANIGSATIDSITSVKSLSTNVTVSGAVKVNSGSTVNVGGINVGKRQNFSQDNSSFGKQNNIVVGDRTFPSEGVMQISNTLNSNTNNIIFINNNQASSGSTIQNCASQMADGNNPLTGQGSIMPICSSSIQTLDSNTAPLDCDTTPSSIHDVFYTASLSSVPCRMRKYLESKQLPAEVSFVVQNIADMFFSSASPKMLSQFLTTNEIDAIKRLLKDGLLKNADSLTKLNKHAGKGAVFDILFGAIGDETKRKLDIGEDDVWKSAFTDIAISALKNTILSSATGPAAVLNFQIGMMVDLTSFSVNQSIKAYEKKAELGGVEKELETSVLTGALTYTNALEKSKKIYNIIQNTEGINAERLKNEMLKVNSLEKIGNNGLEAVAKNYLDYYSERGKSLLLTNPYSNLNTQDVKEVLGCVLKIKNMADSGQAIELFDKKHKTTEVGKEILKMLSNVPNANWSSSDNRIKEERRQMAFSLMETFIVKRDNFLLYENGRSFGVDLERYLKNGL